ncbi:hypothetical protein HH303_18355 [Rhodospirillaceae bacterium KN72]|uniref:Uncharacterized protein n=1 Tax=Pacificispira spongiicola TaxID=2729598 RepID=A0A7Y0E3B3_9PROT|nr:hypothetical protein [Pacificispira spongiicola]NMM46459.1 hypothetical protein [Pacificispira spongiicola]
MPENRDCYGAAALSICEALLLAIKDLKVLPEHEIVGLLEDAAASHEFAVHPDAEADMHREASVLIHRIIDGGISVRR